MLYLWGSPDEHYAENKDQHMLLVQSTTIELELSGSDAETNNTKDPQLDEKVYHVQDTDAEFRTTF